MAYTQAQRDALAAAIATGALNVRSPDGSSITYRSTDEMLKVLAAMDRDLGTSAATPRPRATLAAFQRGW